MPLETTEVLKRYPNPVFVETGTYKGDGVQKALDAGFETVHSMELHFPLYHRAMVRFGNNPNVKIWYGDTSKHFAGMIASLNQPTTFWLDSHVSGSDSGYNPECPHPLMKELEIVARHPVAGHTILMDDRRFFENDWGMPEGKIRELIRGINPEYQFCYEDGYQKDDIMVAYLPGKRVVDEETTEGDGDKN